MQSIFISYRHVHPDEACALQLAEFLTANGFDVFTDRQLLAGQRWAQEIERRLRSAQHFIVLLSAESVLSDMVRQEVFEAYRLDSGRKLRIYPVRLGFDGELPLDLASYLNPKQHLRWIPNTPWQPICQQLLEAINAPSRPPNKLDAFEQASEPGERLLEPADSLAGPLPAADPRMDTGAVEIDSAFYVERLDDREVKRLAGLSGRTVLIKGPRQIGKTSLLTRAKAVAEGTGHRVVYIDFQLVDPDHLSALHKLALYLGHRIARTLRTTVKPLDVWDHYLGAPESLTDYIEQAVLVDAAPCTICFDEVDRVFDYDYRNDFFAMVRAWHNRRAVHPAWTRLGLLIAHSTEPALFIDDLNQSPFNVGEIFRLRDFETPQIVWLNERHGNVLRSSRELAALEDLLGGHPYLIRQAFYVLATKRVDSLADLMSTADDDRGPFGDHLRRHLFGLSQRPKLSKAFREIVRERKCHSEVDFQRLKAAGLVEGPTRESARVRCHLYQRYFARQL